VVLASCASARNEPRAEHPRNDSVILELESKAAQSASFATPEASTDPVDQAPCLFMRAGPCCIQFSGNSLLFL
jgi:hypothetical protein